MDEQVKHGWKRGGKLAIDALLVTLSLAATASGIYLCLLSFVFLLGFGMSDGDPYRSVPKSSNEFQVATINFLGQGLIGAIVGTYTLVYGLKRSSLAVAIFGGIAGGLSLVPTLGIALMALRVLHYWHHI